MNCFDCVRPRERLAPWWQWFSLIILSLPSSVLSHWLIFCCMKFQRSAEIYPGQIDLLVQQSENSKPSHWRKWDGEYYMSACFHFHLFYLFLSFPVAPFRVDRLRWARPHLFPLKLSVLFFRCSSHLRSTCLDQRIDRHPKANKKVAPPETKIQNGLAQRWRPHWLTEHRHVG